jgi:hypothetical protein
MWDFLKEIAGAIVAGAEALWNICIKIVRAVISFVDDILSGLFDILEEIFGDDMPETVHKSPAKPFVTDLDKLGIVIKDAPVSDQGIFRQKNKNLLKGVYDTRTGQIIKPTYVAGDRVDNQTMEILKDEPLVILG